MDRRRTSLISGIVIGTLTLAACGGSDQVSSPTVADAPPVTAGANDDTSEVESEAPASDGPASTDAPSTDAPSTEAVVQVEPDEVEQPTASEPAAETEPILAEPILGGRTLAVDVQPAARFDANPFPDLVVDDVGKGTQVNVANILPSDRPVLLWAWAPH